MVGGGKQRDSRVFCCECMAPKSPRPFLSSSTARMKGPCSLPGTSSFQEVQKSYCCLCRAKEFDCGVTTSLCSVPNAQA